MKLKAFFFIILTTILISVAQIFFKLGIDDFIPNIYGIIFNYYLILGFFFYGLGSITLILSFKQDDISKIYPIIGVVYVWVLILSYYFFNENITFPKIMGVTSILTGVFLITK